MISCLGNKEVVRKSGSPKVGMKERFLGTFFRTFGLSDFRTSSGYCKHNRMTLYKYIASIFLLTISLLVVGQNTPPKPNPPKLVNDLAGVLSSDEVARLERKLVAYDDSTSSQIAIVLIKTLNDYPIEEYALKLYRDWGIGNKKTNNGVLIVAAIDDRKIRIEVGYGLEGAIPDIIANQIIRDDIGPNFRNENYFEGLNSAAESIIKAATGEYKAPQGYGKKKGVGGKSILGMIIVFIIIIIALANRRGGGGGGGGGMMSRRGYGSVADSIFWGALLGGMGRGGGGGGGGWSGGGGGGFGGFGGGSSGGGGASGSW